MQANNASDINTISPADFEFKHVKPKDMTFDPYNVCWVTSLNDLTQKATLTIIAGGTVEFKTVPFSKLAAEWEILPGTATENLREFFKAVKGTDKLKYLSKDWFFQKTLPFASEEDCAIAGLRDLVVEADQLSTPVIAYRSPDQRSGPTYVPMSSKDAKEVDISFEAIALNSFSTYDPAKYPQLLIPSSFIAKHWENLPLVGYKKWQDILDAGLAAETAKATKPIHQDRNALLLSENTFQEAFLLLGGRGIQVSLVLGVGFDENGNFFLKYRLESTQERDLPSDIQRAMLAHFKAAMPASATLDSLSSEQSSSGLFNVEMRCKLSCLPNVDAVEKTHRDVIAALDMYLPYQLIAVSSLYQEVKSKKYHQEAVNSLYPTSLHRQAVERLATVLWPVHNS